MSVVNLQTSTISLVANGTPVVVNKTVYQPSLDSSDPAEQLLVSVKLSNVPVTIPNGQTPADWALTAANNIILPASGARKLLLTRAVLRDISYADISGTDDRLLIGTPAFSGQAAIPGVALFDVAVAGNGAIVMTQQAAVPTPASNTISNNATAAAGQMIQFLPGANEQVNTTAADTAVLRINQRLLLDADADVIGSGAVSLRVTPVADASTDNKRAAFTVDVFGFLLPPL
jgi:hypothetical protein